MPLTGTFDCLDVDALLALLAHRRATGRLQLRAGTAHGAVLLSEGQIVDAHATGNDTNLVADWQERAEELCCRALRAPRGGFEFVPSDVAPSPTASPVDVDVLLHRARQRAEAWETVEAVIPDWDAVPRLAATLTAQDVTLDRDQWAVLVAIDGRRTIAGLARRLDLGLLRCCQLLLPLIEAGAVELAREPELVAPRLPPVPSAEPGDLGEEPAASAATPAVEPARSEAPGHDDTHASSIVRIRRRTAATPAPAV